jgi:cytoskeleton protein RodZ
VPLRLRFEREAWVEVRDASGKLLLHGTQPAGSARDIAGRKPYSLVIGNAAHVRLEHDGREINLGAIARQGVARLKID